jgi:hypothetical protein
MCPIAEILKIEGKPTIYSYNVLKTATKNFQAASKLGEGGFGAVYKVTSTQSSSRMNVVFVFTENTYQCKNTDIETHEVL